MLKSKLKSIHWVNSSAQGSCFHKMTSALARLERFGEKDPFFKKWRSCRHCLQSEWALVNFLKRFSDNLAEVIFSFLSIGDFQPSRWPNGLFFFWVFLAKWLIQLHWRLQTQCLKPCALLEAGSPKTDALQPIVKTGK